MASHVQYVRKEVDKNYYDADNSHFQCCTRKPLLLHSGHSPLPSPPPRHSWCHGGLAHQHCSLEWGCCRDVQSRSWLLNPVCKAGIIQYITDYNYHGHRTHVVCRKVWMRMFHAWVGERHTKIGIIVDYFFTYIDTHTLVPICMYICSVIIM